MRAGESKEKNKEQTENSVFTGRDKVYQPDIKEYSRKLIGEKKDDQCIIFVCTHFNLY